MKELISKEVLFFFTGIIVAIPIGILFMYLVQFIPGTEMEIVLEIDLLLIGGIIGFAGVYIARLAVWSVKAVLKV